MQLSDLWSNRRRTAFTTLTVIALIAFSCALRPQLPGEVVQAFVKPIGDMHQGHQHLSCGACHDGHMGSVARQFSNADDGARLRMSQRCVSCHQAQEVHHVQQCSTPSCLTCHTREHRGKAALLQMPDGACIKCHGAEMRRADGSPSLLKQIRTFAEHPEFAALRGGRNSDSTRVLFPHDIHAREALPTKDGTKQTLTCASCHELDKTGNAFLPVRYQAHCASCHTLGVRLPATLNGPEWNVLTRKLAETQAPHRSPVEVINELTARMATVADTHPTLCGVWPARGDMTAKNLASWPMRAAKDLAEPLFTGAGGCVACHIPSDKRNELPAFEPTEIRRRWLPKATFDHGPHNLHVDCRHCHAAAASRDSSDILIPGIQSCQSCHGAPANEAHAAPDSCVTCHAFHRHGKRRTRHDALWNSPRIHLP